MITRPKWLVKPDIKPSPTSTRKKKLLFFNDFKTPSTVSIWANKRAEEIELITIEPLGNNEYRVWYYKKCVF